VNKEGKIVIIGALSGVFGGILVSLISGYFQFYTKQSEIAFESYKIKNERKHYQKEELRSLIAKYNIAVHKLNINIRTNDSPPKMDDTLEVKTLYTEITLMGSKLITDQINHHIIALLDYAKKYRTSEGASLHANYTFKNVFWSSFTQLYFEPPSLKRSIRLMRYR